MAERVRQLESKVKAGPNFLAVQICANRLGSCFWDRYCFLQDDGSKCAPEIVMSGLSSYQGGQSTVRGTEYYWLHFLAPIAAFGKQSATWEAAKGLIGLDPGIKTKKIEERLDTKFEYSFWYSVGGNRLQDFITDSIDQAEYRAGVLGMHALETLFYNPNISLSELVENAKKAEPYVEGCGYKSSFYYQLAEKYINPRFGHKLLRTVATVAPFFTDAGIGIIPIDNVSRGKMLRVGRLDPQTSFY